MRLKQRLTRASAIVAVLALSACAGTQGVDTTRKYAPGFDAKQEAVDGLVVGHRLMASGEYELALKAYYRAAGEQGLSVDVLSAIGSANLRLGRLGQAEQMLRRAIKTDESFAPAWNNLGVVLMETGNWGEASRVFRTAFALDGGKSGQIRENLRLSLAKIENPAYDVDNNNRFALVRRGGGTYHLTSTP